ncbi:MAG: hypothetical protein F9K41_00340 [Sphingopyxis terrae]|nr:MAG: hypothetical protein F9K41_00340 [Sphingopyxis terrae]
MRRTGPDRPASRDRGGRMRQRGVGLAWMLVGMVAFMQGAWAQGPGAVRKQVEASMPVTRMLTIRTDGGVAAVELDTPDRLPEGIPGFVAGVASSWRFEPVVIDGAARQVRTRMSARLVAKSTGDGKMLVSVRGADFGDYEATPPEERVSSVSMKPPGYPMAAAQSGAQGTVYLLLKIDPDGSVSDVVAEQVNLRMVASEGQMRQFRDRFARSAVGAAEKWTTLKPFQPSLIASTLLASASAAPWTPGTDSAPPPKISIGRSAPFSASIAALGSFATSEASSPSHSVL